jgi:hypothetical protein
VIRRVSSFVLLSVALASPLSGQPTEGLVPRPVAPLRVPGCPTECCHYGRWTFRESLTLRASPASDAPVILRASPPVHVIADSGFIALDTLGLILVMGPASRSSTEALAVGDTVVVLEPVGEGWNGAWVRGRSIQIEADAAMPPESLPRLGLRLLRPLHEIWWAHVKTATHQAGWVNMEQRATVIGVSDCHM